MSRQSNNPFTSNRLLVIGGLSFVFGVFLVVSISWLWQQLRHMQEASNAIQATSTLAATAVPLAQITEFPTVTPSIPPADTPVPPTDTATASATPTSTLVLAVATTPREHTVVAGDTLIWIAQLYDVTIDEIVALNGLSSADEIFVGQVLQIPSSSLLEGASPPTADPATPAVEETTTAVEATAVATTPATVVANTALPPLPNWAPSLLAGDLDANYPLQEQSVLGNARIHLQPGTYPADNLSHYQQVIEDILADLEDTLGRPIGRPIDVYLAGTLFEVNPGLQGLTQSFEFRTFVMLNGVFHPGEMDYILAHEITHIAATHALGPASSPMLHEGLATYLPQSYLVEDAGYLPHQVICAAAMQTAAFQPATQLVSFSYGGSGFAGHIRTFINYNLSACFVGYLLETYGIEQLDQVYDGGNYEAVYGRSLSELDAAWQASLSEVILSIDPVSFIALVNETAQAYETYLAASTGGIHANWTAYWYINQARLAVNRGNFSQARSALDQFWATWKN